MSKLGNTKTHENLKHAFAGESRRTAATCTSRAGRTSRATRMSAACSATRPKPRPGTRSDTSIS